MDGPSDATTLVVILFTTMFIVPILGRGMKMVYALVNVSLKLLVAITIASVVVGVMRENRHVKTFMMLIESCLSSLGIGGGGVERIYSEVPEKAKTTMRSLMKDGVIRMLEYL